MASNIPLVCCLAFLVQLVTAQLDSSYVNRKFLASVRRQGVGSEDEKRQAIEIEERNVVKKVSCPDNFLHIPQVNGCYKVVLDPLEWTVAGLRCKHFHKDAHLLIINNAKEQQAINSILAWYSESEWGNCYKGNVLIWTAGRRIEPGNSAFVWKVMSASEYPTAAVSEMTYTNWAQKQPDFAGGMEICMEMVRSAHYKWNDGSCLSKSCSVCEIDM